MLNSNGSLRCAFLRVIIKHWTCHFFFRASLQWASLWRGVLASSVPWPRHSRLWRHVRPSGWGDLSQWCLHRHNLLFCSRCIHPRFTALQLQELLWCHSHHRPFRWSLSWHSQVPWPLLCLHGWVAFKAKENTHCSQITIYKSHLLMSQLQAWRVWGLNGHCHQEFILSQLKSIVF